MTPGKHDIRIYAYATLSMPIRWTTGTPAAPVDLTGATVTMQIRERASSPSPAISLTSAPGGGITISNPSGGEFLITISDELTGALTIRKGVYDVVVTSPGGEAYRLIEGVVAVHPGVTKS